MPERLAYETSELHTGARATGRKPSWNIALFTPREAGERLRCSENHIYRLIARGVLRAVDIAQPGSRKPKTRVRSDDLESFIDACTRTANAA